MRVENKLDIIRQHQESSPVSVIPLAEALGLNVYYVDWEADMSGLIEKNNDMGGSSGYAIFVNKNHHSNRRRFTIAHEIAHFVLHQEQIGEGIYDDGMYRSGLSLRVEFEANRLAANILMPWHLIDKALENNYTVQTLASEFGVSKSAMSIRMGIPYEK